MSTIFRARPIARLELSDRNREDFWRNVAVGAEDVCWPWTGKTKTKGYGKFYIKGRTYLAHRVSYALANGETPSSQLVCHRCDNPPCCNPSHRFLGTVSDNGMDASRKGRHHKKRVTHCPHGHEYAGANLIVRAGGRRGCRTCDAESKRRYAEKLKLEQSIK